jgi:ferritin-like metal-binding protein YciE
MSSLYEKGSELMRKGKNLLAGGTDAAIRKSEKVIKIERIKIDIKSMKQEKEEHLRELARKVYEMYTQNNLSDPGLISICQDVKTIQWQIDEKWTEINNLKSRRD